MCFSSFPLAQLRYFSFFLLSPRDTFQLAETHAVGCRAVSVEAAAAKTSQWMHGSKHQRIGARKNIRKWVNIIWLEYFLSTFYTWRKHLKMKIHTCGKIGRFYCSNKYALWIMILWNEKKNPFLPQLIQSCEKGNVFPFFFKTDRLFFLATYGSNFHMRE